MSGDEQKSAPSSWRDVYELVRDTRADLMVAIGNVDTKVTALGDRVVVIERDRHDEKMARVVEAKLAADRDAAARKRGAALSHIAGAGRATIAILISLASFIVVVLKS